MMVEVGNLVAGGWEIGTTRGDGVNGPLDGRKLHTWSVPHPPAPDFR